MTFLLLGSQIALTAEGAAEVDLIPVSVTMGHQLHKGRSMELRIRKDGARFSTFQKQLKQS